MSIGERLDKAGWRQGKIVQVSDHEIFNEQVPGIEYRDRLIVISQSCDIIKVPDAAEPTIELIVAKPINEPDGHYTYNKNSRTLHTSLQTTSDDCPLSLFQNDKFVVDRVLFDDLTPDADVFLESEQVNVMARWLAARYHRPAFPNGFNKRIDAVKRADKKLRQAAKNVSAVVSGIFISISPFRELNDGESYSVNLLALVPVGKDVVLDSAEIIGPIDAIANIMKAANMEVDYQVEREDKVPYSLFRDEFKPWSFDDISLREETPHESPITA